MKNIKNTILFFLLLFSFAINGCIESDSPKEEVISSAENKEIFLSVLQKHLDAVSEKDIEALKSTLSPEGKMQMILPGSEIINSADKFIEYHAEWFQDTLWTFETKILSTEIGEKIGLAVTEIIYREPNRNGNPYFNRMIVSYSLEKIGRKWYIISDHASSIEKTGD